MIVMRDDAPRGIDAVLPALVVFRDSEPWIMQDVAMNIISDGFAEKQ